MHKQYHLDGFRWLYEVRDGSNSAQPKTGNGCRNLNEFGPFTLIILQSTSFCNINCDYCYLPGRSVKRTLSLDLIEPIFKNIFTSQFLGNTFTMCWHAGEPLSVPVSFYEAALAKIQAAEARYKQKDCKVFYSFQTNGTLINQAWCDFFKRYDQKVGVSLDGPAFLHDAHRVTRTGLATHAAVMRGIDHLQRNDVDFRVIAVLTQDAMDYPDEIFQFFWDHGIYKVGFNIDEIEGVNQASTHHRENADARYRAFMRRLWELTKQTQGKFQVREFERVCDMIYRERKKKDSQLVRPFSIVSIDLDGNFSTFSPEFLTVKAPEYGDFVLGNVLHDTFESSCLTDKFWAIYGDVKAGVEMCQTSCEYFSVCGGGAPSNKYWENGTIASTETLYCRYRTQLLTEMILEDVEAMLQSRSGMVASAQANTAESWQVVGEA